MSLDKGCLNGRYPEDRGVSWGKSIETNIKALGRGVLGFQGEVMEKLFTSVVLTEGGQFAYRASQECSNLTMKEITQAIRNIWVVHFCQYMLGVDVCFSQAL